MSLFEKIFKGNKKKSRTEENTFSEIRLNRGYFNVNDVLKDVANILMHDARSKRISIIYRLNKNVPSRLLGDRYKLSNALVELIGNAIDFTDGKHDVIVEIHRNEKNDERNEIHFTITDRGVGMEQSLVDTVLRPMLNSDDPAEAFGIGGNGLQHARDIIHAMHGSIFMKCKVSEGCRVSFYVNFEFEHTNDRRQYHLDSIDGVGLNTLVIDDDTGSARAAKAYLEYFRHAVTLGKLDDLIDAAEYDLVMLSSFYWSRDVKKMLLSLKKNGTNFVLIENTVLHERVDRHALDAVQAIVLKPYTQQGLYEMLNGLYGKQPSESENFEVGVVSTISQMSSDKPATENVDDNASDAEVGTPVQKGQVRKNVALTPETVSFLYGKPVDLTQNRINPEILGCLKLSQEIMVASDGLAACDDNIERYVDQLKELIWKYVKADRVIYTMLHEQRHDKVQAYCQKMKQDFRSAGLYRMYCLCVLLEKSCTKKEEADIVELGNIFSFTLDATIKTIDEFVEYSKYKLGK